MCTLHPLLSTLEQWLTEGQLNNLTGELFLIRDTDIAHQSPLFWSEGLVFKHHTRLKEDQIPGVFLVLWEEMLKAGKAIELLKSLGKLGRITGRELFAQLIDR